MCIRDSAKWVALPGVLLGAGGSWMMTHYTGQVTHADLLVPLFLQGLGMGLMFVPLSTLAFSTLPMDKQAEASGIYSLVRSVSGAVGVSVTSTFLARSTDAQWSELRGYINPFNPAVPQYLEQLGLTPDGRGLELLARALAAQAQLTAFVSSFWFLTASFVVMIPLVLLLKPSQGPRPARVGAAGAS